MWSGKPDAYHALRVALLLRLPLAPSITVALRRKRDRQGGAVPALAGAPPELDGPRRGC